MKDRLEIRPRLCETDLNGHINNTSVMPWLEEGRLQLYRVRAGADQTTLLAHLSVDYRAEVYYGEPAELTSWIEKLGNTSIHYRQQLTQTGRLCLDAQAVSVTFDTQNRRKQAISERSRRALQAWLEPAA